MPGTGGVVHWAALDLGSNSFHLLLVRREGDGFVVVERLKEKVQLLAGFDGGALQPGAHSRGTACLRRFAQRLASLHPDRIVAMGTYALRQASDAGAMVAAHQRVVGAPLEIISGEREAELVYRAVDYYAGQSGLSRLVLDIGGGSTELAVGSGPQPVAVTSVALGCVALKDRCFAGPRTLPGDYARAKAAAVMALHDALADSNLQSAGKPAAVFGTSGTVQSVLTVLRANGLAWDSITRDGLAELEAGLLDGRWVLHAGLPGLAPDRVDIFPPGLAVLAACMEVLDLPEVRYVDVSLLHGMVCEALAKETALPNEDLKSTSVLALADRFGVDRAHARRVQRCAAGLFDAVQQAWDLEPELAQLLGFAAQLHELGTAVNARHYHRHGGYVVKHADLAGFGADEQGVLALLIRGHRRSLPVLAFSAYDPEQGTRLLKLVALLRIAVILERSHSDAHSPVVGCTANATTLRLQLGDAWLQAHPLSARELEVEVGQLAGAGLTLTFG